MMQCFKYSIWGKGLKGMLVKIEHLLESEVISQQRLRLMCFQDFSDPCFFANYSLTVILIEKIIRKMNLDIYRVIEFIFST